MNALHKVEAAAVPAERLGEQCADGGKCHHACTERCFRREHCGPFSDYTGPWAYEQAQQPAAAVPEGYALVQKWREQANAALRRSGTWNGNDMADRIDYMADELEAMLAAARKGETP